jgi:hypothetical protein
LEILQMLQFADVVPDELEQLVSVSMSRIGMQPGIETGAVCSSHIARVQEREPFVALGLDLPLQLAAHSGSSIAASIASSARTHAAESTWRAHTRSTAVPDSGTLGRTNIGVAEAQRTFE